MHAHLMLAEPGVGLNCSFVLKKVEIIQRHWCRSETSFKYSQWWGLYLKCAASFIFWIPQKLLFMFWTNSLLFDPPLFTLYKIRNSSHSTLPIVTSTLSSCSRFLLNPVKLTQGDVFLTLSNTLEYDIFCGSTSPPKFSLRYLISLKMFGISTRI